MREILFRGKRKSNGEWVYGNYCGAEYLTNEGIEHLIIEVPRSGSSAQVILETVGQYTGLTDKNGKKIFEGDILSYIEKIETRSKGKETLKGIYEVKFEYCGFSPLDCLACNHLEIIGNIHDNPELLKGGAHMRKEDGKNGSI